MKEITIDDLEFKDLGSFGIKRDLKDPLWYLYIEWMNIKANKSFEGGADKYYGLTINGNWSYYRETGIFGKILTLKQWYELVKKTDSLLVNII